MDENLTLYEIQDTKFMMRPDTMDESILQEVLFHNVYLNYPRLSIKKDDVVVDVGAHIGAFTVLAAKLLGAIVFAYEPDPVNYELLKTNIKLNEVEDRVIVQNCAVMNYSGIGKLSQDTFNQGSHSLCEFWMLDKPTIEVPVIKFDSKLWGEFEILDFLKMDCEGAEHCIILDSDLSKIRQIAIEYHGSEDILNKLIKQLEKEDFEVLQKTGIYVESISLGQLRAVRKAKI